MKHPRTLTLAHWGVYEVEYDDAGKASKLHPFSRDPDPSPIGLHMLSDEVARLRVRRPAIRKGWLERGPGAASDKRGEEPFVEVPWDEALDRSPRNSAASRKPTAMLQSPPVRGGRGLAYSTTCQLSSSACDGRLTLETAYATGLASSRGGYQPI